MMADQSYCIGVDAGATRTDAVAYRTDGTELARSDSGCGNPAVAGTESALSQQTYILHREKVPKGLGRSTRRFLRKCGWEVKRVRAVRRMG